MLLARPADGADVRVLLLLAALAGHPDLLVYAAPLFLLAVPLLAGRYVGEERLERLRRSGRPPSARLPPVASAPSGCGPPAALLPRGGRLIADGAGRAPAARPLSELGARTPLNGPGAPTPEPRSFRVLEPEARSPRRSLRCSWPPLQHFAHEGNPNYRSEVRAIAPAVPGLDAHVLNFDDRIEFVYDGDRDAGRRRLPRRAIPALPPRRARAGEPALAGRLPQRGPLRAERRAGARRPPARRPAGRRSRATAATTGTTTASTGWARVRCRRRSRTSRGRSKVFDWSIPLEVAGTPGAGARQADLAGRARTAASRWPRRSRSAPRCSWWAGGAGRRRRRRRSPPAAVREAW